MAVDAVQSNMQALFKSSAAKTKSTSELGFNDFLKLIAAQMQNQDMMNPMKDTDFIAQMAQFSSLQAIQNLSLVNTTTYSVGLLGKDVTVARLLSTGELEVKTGAVTGVGLYDGDPVIFLGDESYSLSEIMVVGKMPTAKTEETPAPIPDPDDGII